MRLQATGPLARELIAAMSLDAGVVVIGVLFSAVEAYIKFSRHQQDLSDTRAFRAAFQQPILSLLVLTGVIPSAARLVHIFLKLAEAPKCAEYGEASGCSQYASLKAVPDSPV
jgi:hypothetical protein